MPSRVVREGILDSKRIGLLSIGAELFYRKLMSIVDDFGRYECDVSILRVRLYARRLEQVSEQDIEGWIAECKKTPKPLVLVYTIDDKDYISIEEFNQQLKAKFSKFPAPPASVYGRVREVEDSHSRASIPISDSDIRYPLLDSDSGCDSEEEPEGKPSPRLSASGSAVREMAPVPSQRKPSPTPLPNPEGNPELFSGLLFAAKQALMGWAEPELPDIRDRFGQYPVEDRKRAIDGLRDRIDCGEYEQPQYVPRFKRYVFERLWTAPLRPKAKPKGPVRIHDLFDEAQRLLREEKRASG